MLCTEEGSLRRPGASCFRGCGWLLQHLWPWLWLVAAAVAASAAVAAVAASVNVAMAAAAAFVVVAVVVVAPAFSPLASSFPPASLLVPPSWFPHHSLLVRLRFSIDSQVAPSGFPIGFIFIKP